MGKSVGKPRARGPLCCSFSGSTASRKKFPHKIADRALAQNSVIPNIGVIVIRDTKSGDSHRAIAQVAFRLFVPTKHVSRILRASAMTGPCLPKTAHAANALYEMLGYRACAAYNDNSHADIRYF